MKSQYDMKNTTLCYIEKDGAYLMMHRIKKQNDINHDKWVGIGGKFQSGESPFDCVRREVMEETGLNIISLKYRGIVTFVSNEYGTEYMHLFTSSSFSGEVKNNCDEGELVWIRKEQVFNLPIWEGDRIFLELIQTEQSFFSLKLEYQGDKLISYQLEK